MEAVSQDVAGAQTPQDFRFFGPAADVHHQRHSGIPCSRERLV
jgi:hypothetical protein